MAAALFFMRSIPCLVVAILALLVLPVQAGYWKYQGAQVAGKPGNSEGWITSATTSGTGVLLLTQLSASSSHSDRGQSFVSKGDWTIPAQALVPGERLVFQIDLVGQKVELGGHWHLGHSLALFAGRHKAGVPATAADGMQQIAATGTGTAAGAPKTNRATGEWTVPEGTADFGLSFRVEGFPGQFSVTYAYLWVEGSSPVALPSTGGHSNRVAPGGQGGVGRRPADRTSPDPRSGTSVTEDGTSAGGQEEGFGGPIVGAGQEVELFRNGDSRGVSNGGKAAGFVLDRPARITSILAYHYNNGAGAPAGSLQVMADDGTLYGAWPAALANRLNWVVQPNVVLPPGHYRVIDSDPATWAQNAGSNQQGHVIIKGVWGGGRPTAAPGPRAAGPVPGLAPRLAGTWRGTYRNSRNEPGTYEVSIREVDGRIEGRNDGLEILDGKRVGDTLTWRMQRGGASWESTVRILDGGATLVETYTGRDQRRDKDNGTYTGEGTLRRQ